jgi:hypothetical protein
MVNSNYIDRLLIWLKALEIPEAPGYSIDRYGNIIKFSDYGNIASQYGWEVDHNIPKSKGGTDDYDNLQPLHWRQNRQKSNH